MSWARDLLKQAYRNQRRHLFPVEVRKKLHEMGIVVIRQSSYERARFCSMQQFLMSSGKYVERSSVEALFGSALHLAIEEVNDMDGDQAYWYDVLCRVIARHPNTVYYNGGNVVQDHHLVDWAADFATGASFGVPLAVIVARMDMALNTGKLKVSRKEYNFRFTDGSPDNYPISIEGTIDYWLTNQYNRSAIGDTKSFGLWSRTLEKGGNKKQTGEAEDLFWDPQLGFYQWATWRIGGCSQFAQEFIHLLPANAVPYRVGEKKGMDRGPILARCRAPGVEFIEAYERDLVDFYTALTKTGPIRTRPRSYGKQACAECPALSACIGDPQITMDRKVLAGPEFDFMREKK